MTEATPQPPATAPPAAPESPAQAETDWKAEARKWEQRAKENNQRVQELQPLADQFRSLDEASKSEAQRLQEALEVSNRERDTRAAEALRYQVAIDHGIGKEDLELLGAGTQEELAARAVRVAELRAAALAAAQPPVAPPTPHTVPDLRPGATPPPPPNNDSVEARYQQFMGAHAPASIQ